MRAPKRCERRWPKCLLPGPIARRRQNLQPNSRVSMARTMQPSKSRKCLPAHCKGHPDAAIATWHRIREIQFRGASFGRFSMRASSLSYQSAVLFAIAGIIWGLVMAISENHAAMPAHAHLNLLGWVSLFLFGIFYQLHPSIDRSRVAVAQVAIWIVATIVMVTGIWLIHSGREIGEPIAAVGSLAVFADMLVFGWLVARRGRYGD